MSANRALVGLLLLASLALGGCGGAPEAPPISEWCTDPPRGGSGNAVLTLVKRPEASLPPQISMQFNDQPEVTFVDDGTGIDAKAGDGVYTRSANLAASPTGHACSPLLTEGQSSSALSVEGAGALSQAVDVMGSCTVKSCTGCLGSSLGLPCFCVRCDITITF